MVIFPGRTKVFFNRIGPLGRQKVLLVLRGMRGGNLAGRGAMMHEFIRQNIKSVHYFSAIRGRHSSCIKEGHDDVHNVQV